MKPGPSFQTLDVGVLVYARQLRSLQKQPDLKLKTRPKQILGYLPLAFTLPNASKHTCSGLLRS
jgi:hypothetical protein